MRFLRLSMFSARCKIEELREVTLDKLLEVPETEFLGVSQR